MINPQPNGFTLWIYKSAAIYIFIVNLLSQIINYYWFYLIILQVNRNINKLSGKGGDVIDVQMENQSEMVDN